MEVCMSQCLHKMQTLIIMGLLNIYHTVSSSSIQSVTYIRGTGNSKEIPILNSNSSVGPLTQVNEGKSISFIYTVFLYRGFAIHSVISLLFTKTSSTFTNTEIV